MNQSAIENTYIKMDGLENPNQTFQIQLEQRASSPELSASKLAELYIETLSPKERKAYMIAREHLGMSFTLEKSVGFLKWKSTL
jgi:hypothetical protein